MTPRTVIARDGSIAVFRDTGVDEERLWVPQWAAKAIYDRGRGNGHSSLEAITEAIHHAMCEVSHHDSFTVCKNARRFELIAISVHEHLVGA